MSTGMDSQRQPIMPRLILVPVLSAVLLLALAGAKVEGGRGSASSASPLVPSCTTTVSADIASSTTWDLAGSPYCVQTVVEVASSATLTVDPGVTVYFTSTISGLTVSGSLVAAGTQAKPIIFTSYQASPQPGDWERLAVLAGGAMHLEYADVSYGGHGQFTPSNSEDCTNPYYLPLADYGAASVWVEDYAPAADYPAVEIRHSRLHHNRGSGLYFYGKSCDACGVKGGWDAIIEDTQIDHNTGVAICENHWLSELYSAPAYSNLTLSDNGADALVLANGHTSYVDRTFDGPGSFNGKPIHLINGAHVWMADGGVLTITPGTTVLFSPYAPDIGSRGDLSTGTSGSLVAEGTAEQPIVFTSGAPVPQTGDWGRLTVREGRLAYCEISYGGVPGSGSWGSAALQVGDDVTVRRCDIHDNDVGVESDDDAYPFSTITENDIHDNRIGVQVSGTSPDLWGNNIYQNRDYGLVAVNELWEPDARNIWWGHPTGPYHPVSNPSGLGDRLEDAWWQGYETLPAKFIPWRTTPAEGTPPTLQALSPTSGALFSHLPIRFQLKAEDPDEGEPLFFKVEIFAGYAPFTTYDLSQDPTGWDRAKYIPDESGEIVAILDVPEALPNGDYTWQASVMDGWHTVTTARQSFRVNVSGWDVAGVTPSTVVAIPKAVQTLAIYGTGFASAAQVWLEQARYDGQVDRLDPSVVQFVSGQLLAFKVDLIGRSGPYEVVVSQGGEERRVPLWVVPYLALTSLNYMNEPDLVMNDITPHQLQLTNHGTADGVAVVGLIVPTGTQALLPNESDPTQFEYLGQTDDRTHLYAFHLAAQESRLETLYFSLPQSAVNVPGQTYDPRKHDWGDPLRFKFWVLAQPTEEGWQVLRQETANLEELITGAVAGSALIEGWAIDQYMELADEASAREYIERLGSTYPFIADALVARQLQEFQLLANLALDYGDVPETATSLSEPPAQASGDLGTENGWFGDWVRRQIGDPWSFTKGFLLQANEDGIPWSSGSMEHERGVFAVAEGESLLKGLTFGLYKPFLGYWNYSHINGKEKGLIEAGEATGELISIPAGFVVPELAGRGMVAVVRKSAKILQPGGDRYWRMFKLTVEGNTQEPARLGVSVIWKSEDNWVTREVGKDLNLIHWGDNPSFGGSHVSVGWSRQPVVINDVIQYGAKNEVLYGSGPHLYTGHAYLPYKWNGAPIGQINNISVLRSELGMAYPLSSLAWRAGMVPESFRYPYTFVDETACGDGSQTLAASWDPNDIQGLPHRTHIRPTQPLEFLIRFENVATATLPADTVTVTLALHPNLDWDSIRMLGSSHPDEVAVNLDPADRTMVATFAGIDLPPNQTPPEGEGWLRLRVTPSATLTTGQQITAQAMIEFDRNEPIWTNRLTYTIDLDPPDAWLSLVSSNGIQTKVRLTATDNPGGSGLGNVGLFYSRDNANWVGGPVLTTETPKSTLSGTVTLVVPGGHYWLRAAASDLNGNVSPVSDKSIEIDVQWPYQMFLPMSLRSR